MAPYSNPNSGVRPPEPTKLPDLRMVITIPADLADMAQDIRRFLDAMVYKLEKNQHKGRWGELTLEQAFGLLTDEVSELRAEVGGNTMKTILEAADVANFALIIASIAVERGR